MSAKKAKKRIKVEVKTEKDELKSMSHYVDDRVELVKQIFSCLKSKTIKHLAPDFLKESSLEEIEELCLNELLGLSTKRLLSIINATKCPTDTESSSDSDVHNVEEHISLEEISSESEAEKNNANKKKRTKKDRTLKTQQGGTNDKSVSVLELLELQARARAIRSQLALEPVAKIEVDSDDSIEGGIQSNDTSIASSSNTKENKQPQKPQQTSSEKLSNGAKSKRIKLKRNFRKQNRSEPYEEESQNTDKEETKVESKESEETKDTGKNNVNGDNKTRSPSPDVITILPSPETLCISDSSDEDEKNVDTVKNDQDKSCTILESKKQLVELDSEKDEEDSRPIEPQENKKENETASSKSSEPNTDLNKASEIEEGEIIDSKEIKEAENTSETNTQARRGDDQQKSNENSDSSRIQNTVDQPNVEEPSKSDSPIDTERSSTDRSRQTLKSQFSEKRNDSYDDSNQQNDDVISLVHDDLEDEFQENEVSEVITSKEVKLEKINTRSKDQESAVIEQHDNDIITLHNSSDEDSTLDQFADTKESQSWNSRWLKSNRVSKILATSRLGNRVREKIKKTKKQNEEAEEEEKIEEVPEVFQSQFEEGSVQQYAEILERTS